LIQFLGILKIPLIGFQFKENSVSQAPDIEFFCLGEDKIPRLINFRHIIGLSMIGYGIYFFGLTRQQEHTKLRVIAQLL